MSDLMNDFSKNQEEMSAPDSAYQSRISQQYSSLSKNQRKIAKYFQTHEQEVLRSSITRLAQKIGTTPSTISRFCQALHYKGFSDMKFSIEKKLVYSENTEDNFNDDDELFNIKKKYFNLYQKALADTILNISEQSIYIAAKEILNANRVYIYSSGASGSSAHYIYQLLMQIEIPCNYFTDRQIALMSIGQLQKGDVAIAVNFSGASSTLLELLTLAKQNKVSTIAITSDSGSYIGRIVDLPLCYSTMVEDDLRYVHVARMCELAIIGLLQTAIMQQASKTNQNYLKYTKLAIEKARSKA